MRRLFSCAVLCALLLVVVACGGGDDPNGSATPATTGPGGIATLSGLQGQLAAVLLQPSDVPDGLDAGAPAFSTNQDIAGTDQQALQQLVEQGRQLGVDVTFLPTPRLDPASPIRGGIQNSASVYTSSLGAGDSFRQTEAAARGNNWQANHPEMLELKVTEVPVTFGDESIWLRLAGKDCLTSPPNGSTAQPCDGQQHMVFLDIVIFQVGRVRAFLQTQTLFDVAAAPDVYQDQISQWAAAIVQHAKATFPSS